MHAVEIWVGNYFAQRLWPTVDKYTSYTHKIYGYLKVRVTHQKQAGTYV